jgi:hypothetical protein
MTEPEFLRQSNCFFYYQVDHDLKPTFTSHDVEEGKNKLYLYMTELNLGQTHGGGKTAYPWPELKYVDGNVYEWNEYQDYGD